MDLIVRSYPCNSSFWWSLNLLANFSSFQTVKIVISILLLFLIQGLTVSEIQEKVADAVNALVKYYYREKEIQVIDLKWFVNAAKVALTCINYSVITIIAHCVNSILIAQLISQK